MRKVIIIVVVVDNIWFMSFFSKVFTGTAKMLMKKESAQAKSTQSTPTMESRSKYTAT